MKKVLLYIVSTLFIFAHANAVNFTVGVSGNNSVFAGEGTEIDYNESGGVFNRTTEYGAFHDVYPSVFLEVGNDVVSIGLDYVPIAIETPENINDSNLSGGKTTPESKVQVDFENHYTIYALVRAPWYGLYLKAGITETEVVINETQKSGNTYADQNTDGYTVALGSEIDTGAGLNLRIEVAGSIYDDVKTNNGVATTGNRNEIIVESMIGATGRLSLVKTF